jgi:D-lyxose ketol-isomerase
VKDRQTQKRKDILIDVCCYDESKLIKQFQERGGGAIRISLPKHDLSKEETEKAIVKVVKKMQSEGFKVHVWTSLPCSPWCAWQRVNKAILHNYKKFLKRRGRAV